MTDLHRRQLERATARMHADFHILYDTPISLKEAERLVLTTFTGRCMLLHEAAKDVGHAIYDALPGWFRRRFPRNANDPSHPEG
jgi:hypothetical protein